MSNLERHRLNRFWASDGAAVASEQAVMIFFFVVVFGILFDMYVLYVDG